MSMSAKYGQFCPMAKAMEVLDERWTLLVVRELLRGSTHFNELRRGVPRISPALLSKRLRTLERAGVLRRTGTGGRTSYHLTESGTELGAVVDSLTWWGLRWVGELGDEDLDPHLLFWDVRRTLDPAAWPRGRTVVAFDLADVGPRARRWWLVVADDVEVCDFDPGYDVDAQVTTTLRALTEVWRGDRTWRDAIGNGLVTISGAGPVQRAVPRWLGHSGLASLQRPARDQDASSSRSRAPA
jgi:DNA-binding HxlR family transcriptional regulator